eukprot:TRINITY_DN39782_c0_g1_i1.p1 TRINITY_DN39782_c0_g1~~TRINITY_DN39782_c0_g1_i1.p1  ORF type:complete len:196 (+),score=47.19 TRINITY_DN39782_c0_g1_i1:202-789(+)
MCQVQLMLIDLAQDLTANQSLELSTAQSMVLADCFETAFTFAQDFNRNHRARTKLWNRDMIESMPDLIGQEIVSLRGLLTTLLRLYKEEEESETAVEFYLMRTVKSVLNQYICKTIQPTLHPEESAEFHAFTPVIVQVLTGLAEFNDRQFKSQVKSVYLLLVELMQCKHMDVRMALHRIFLRIGEVFELSSIEEE